MEETRISSPGKNRILKRKREDSSDTDEDILPENSIEVEKNVYASAVKNNLDDVSIRKILKKVVTNDHVLALVKLQEEEELTNAMQSVIPKLTRAKAKELMNTNMPISPEPAMPWNIALVPIDHIPVKTRPEVKALIAQELPEDEDDEEYKPNNDDVPSDDDHVLETSDIESQPRTPATPSSQKKSSPTPVTDGPFKVPQETASVARRKLDMEEDATIALRTRSKLCLSETPIEHIESSFVPPDDLPVPDVDDLWSDFLKECLDPAPSARHEEDDEADPEYNVAADPDAADEDEESLERNILKISKKELNDLVTELLSEMPAVEPTANDFVDNTTMEPRANETDTASLLGVQKSRDNSAMIIVSEVNQTQWEGKQEPLSDEECRQPVAATVVTRPVSIGKMEIEDSEVENNVVNGTVLKEIQIVTVVRTVPVPVKVEERMETIEVTEPVPPPAVRNVLEQTPPEILLVEVKAQCVITSQQIQIFQQQLRQHIQLCVTNFMQLYVNPTHWSFAPDYKGYLTSLNNVVEKNPASVVYVCNLKPAVELVTSWESTLSGDTEENKEIVMFMKNESDKGRRRTLTNHNYKGNFPEVFMNVVANSSVFLYPYMLPPTPYRGEKLKRRSQYYPSEEQLIVLAIDEFWQYVDDNPEIYKRPNMYPAKHRWGLHATVELVCKYVFPWVPTKTLLGHITSVRKHGNKNHPINKFMRSRYVEPVTHTLVSYNPQFNLYQQPEHEIPTIWIRYLAKSNKRFQMFLNRKTRQELKKPANGVVLDPNNDDVVETEKTPLPADFIKVTNYRRGTIQTVEQQPTPNLVAQDPLIAAQIFTLVNTSTGPVLVPLTATTGEVIKPVEVIKETTKIDPKHCYCCVMLRRICKYKQKLITDYFNKRKQVCPCRSVKFPKITNRLRLLCSYYRRTYKCVYSRLERAIKEERQSVVKETSDLEDKIDPKDLSFVTAFQIKLLMRENKTKNPMLKCRIYNALSKFEVDKDNPMKLMEDLSVACDIELADIYKEFLCFLTPEQAEQLDMFKDYFVNNCVEGLIDKIQESTMDKQKKHILLQQIMSLFKGEMSSCEMCCRLLTCVQHSPELANYCFHLFPHQRKQCDTSEDDTVINSINNLEKPNAVINSKSEGRLGIYSLIKENPKRTLQIFNGSGDETEADIRKSTERDDDDNGDGDDLDRTLTICNDAEDEPESRLNTHEAGNSLSDTRQDNNTTLNIAESLNDDVDSINEFKYDPVLRYEDDTDEESDKMDVQEQRDKEDNDYSDVEVKCEASEWKRDEDKLILEVLKECLTPQEIKDKTIIEIIEDKSLPNLISDALTTKSLQDVRDRIVYLLEVLNPNHK